MPTVEVEVYHVWWEVDTDTFPPLSLLTFPHHGGILSWWEYAGKPPSSSSPISLITTNIKSSKILDHNSELSEFESTTAFSSLSAVRFTANWAATKKRGYLWVYGWTMKKLRYFVRHWEEKTVKTFCLHQSKKLFIGQFSWITNLIVNCVGFISSKQCSSLRKEWFQILLVIIFFI